MEQSQRNGRGFSVSALFPIEGQCLTSRGSESEFLFLTLLWPVPPCQTHCTCPRMLACL